MKRMKSPALLLALLLLVTFSSCELIQSRYRPLPPVIQLYNSALEKTLNLAPNDTLYVQVSGLAPNSYYDVECLDVNDGLITMLTAESDATGVIQPTPLWYDIGLKWDPVAKKIILDSANVGVDIRSFKVRVKNSSNSGSLGIKAATTDFKLEFFIVYKSNITRPQPIVMAGKVDNGNNFYLENAFDAGDQLYLKVANLEELPTGNNSGYATIYVVPFSGDVIEDGAYIEDYYFSLTATVAELKSASGKLIPWLNDPNNPLIPTSDQGKAYSIILDTDNNRYYNVRKDGLNDYYLDGMDGNGVAGFIVRRNMVAAQTISLNLVSGGMFTYNYTNYQYDYDYRDVFKKDGSDTKVASYYGVGPGVKVIWNPYTYYQNWSTDPVGAQLYYGRYVDLYIIKSGGSAVGWNVVDLKDTSIVVRKLRLPVQYGCANGLNQQTIWPAPMDVGDYALVLDMDGSETLNDGDIVDDLDRRDAVRFGITNTTQRSGFSIRE